MDLIKFIETIKGLAGADVGYVLIARDLEKDVVVIRSGNSNFFENVGMLETALRKVLKENLIVESVDGSNVYNIGSLLDGMGDEGKDTKNH